MLLLVVAVLGLLGIGGAAGWWAATQFAPRYAPDVNITVDSGPGARSDSPAMPDVRGLTEAEARQVIADAGFGKATVKSRQQASVAPVGTVVSQEPVAGAPVTGQVTLVLASAATVPSVVGRDVRVAVRDIQAMGASVEVRRAYQAGSTVDTVLAVEPATGQAVPDHVVLTAASPPATAYLVELAAMQNTCAPDAVTVSGVRYEHAVHCVAVVGTFTEASYQLNRRALRLDAVLGQPDNDIPGRAVQYAVLADGRVVVSGVLRYGETRTLSLNTAGVVRLVLRVTADSASTGVTLAFGDARVTAGPAEIAAIRAGG